MTANIKFKRDGKKLLVLKQGRRVASIQRSTPADVGHRSEEPWMLVHTSGRIDRHPCQQDARNDALKI